MKKLTKEQEVFALAKIREAQLTQESALAKAEDAADHYNAAVRIHADIMKRALSPSEYGNSVPSSDIAKQEGNEAYWMNIIKSAIKDYNEAAVDLLIYNSNLDDRGIPVLWLLEHIAYKVLKVGTLKDGVRVSKSSNVREIEIVENVVDAEIHKLPNLEGIGVNPIWFEKVKLLTNLVAAQTMSDLSGSDIEACKNRLEIKIPEGLEKFEFSKTNIRKIIPSIVADLIGDEYTKQIISADATVLQTAFGRISPKKGKDAIGVTNPRLNIEVRSQDIVQAFITISDRILNGGEYTVSARIKERKADLWDGATTTEQPKATTESTTTEQPKATTESTEKHPVNLVLEEPKNGSNKSNK